MRIICTILLVALIAGLTAGDVLALDEKQVGRWAQDIRYYQETLRARHIDLYHSVSQEKFDGELEDLIQRLPSLRENQVIFELMRITRLVNDGHTQLPIMAGPHTHYPLRFRLFGDEVRVVATAEPYRALLGGRVVTIEGKPIREVLEILSPAVQAVENEFSLKSSLAFHLTVDDMLYGAGITETIGSAEFTCETDAGSVVSATVASLSMRDFVEQTRHRVGPELSFGERAVEISDGLWLATDKEASTAYLHFSAYPSFDEMLDFAQRVRKNLEMNAIRNIIIDLRDNGGGDFYTGLALSQPILMTESIDWMDGVYVLIGRNTFSAAMSNAVQFKQILNATLVGEPTGANPVGYQELGTFQLPHSGRTVFYSERFYRFQDTETSGVQPDVLIEIDADAYLAGVDQTLDWVTADIESRN